MGWGGDGNLDDPNRGRKNERVCLWAKTIGDRLALTISTALAAAADPDMTANPKPKSEVCVRGFASVTIFLPMLKTLSISAEVAGMDMMSNAICLTSWKGQLSHQASRVWSSFLANSVWVPSM